MNLLWRTKPASSRQHGQAEATELGVAVYAVAVVEEFSHDRADKHGANGCQERPPSLLSLSLSLSGVNPPSILSSLLTNLLSAFPAITSPTPPTHSDSSWPPFRRLSLDN